MNMLTKDMRKKMLHKTIYLAGPIAGLSYEDARNGWRKDFAALMPDHIQCLSPMRAKQFLSGVKKLAFEANAYDNPLATAKGIVTRDRNDVKTCDLMVANFLGAQKGSLGTAMEFGWADAWRKPVILIIEKDGVIQPEVQASKTTRWQAEKINPHFHPMLTASAGYVVDTIEEAAYIAKHILTPGV